MGMKGKGCNERECIYRNDTRGKIVCFCFVFLLRGVVRAAGMVKKNSG